MQGRAFRFVRCMKLLTQSCVRHAKSAAFVQSPCSPVWPTGETTRQDGVMLRDDVVRLDCQWWRKELMAFGAVSSWTKYGVVVSGQRKKC
jgi:hypothetical protein